HSCGSAGSASTRARPSLLTHRPPLPGSTPPPPPPLQSSAGCSLRRSATARRRPLVPLPASLRVLLPSRPPLLRWTRGARCSSVLAPVSCPPLLLASSTSSATTTRSTSLVSTWSPA